MQFYKNYDWAQEPHKPYATFTKDDELFCLLCGVRTEAHFSGRPSWTATALFTHFGLGHPQHAALPERPQGPP